MTPRRFLWAIVAGLALVVAAAFAFVLIGQEKLTRVALTPTLRFADSPQDPAPDYTRAAAWLARPDKPAGAEAFTPPGYTVPPRPQAALFYVAPTAFLDRTRWNAPLGDRDTNDRLALYLRTQASVWNGSARISAPVYRQATFGAFLKRTPDSIAAIDLAYGDVERAWDAFLAANPTGPILIAGHSQGALHLQRLLARRISGTPAAARIVAVYIPGWPLSVEADLPALGLPACATPVQTGCILAWMSFAEPADAREFLADTTPAPTLTGRARAGTRNLCVNPIRGFATQAPAVPAANMGALTPGKADADAPTLVARTIGARCAGGVLLIGPPPAGFGRYIMSGNNYHVYDTSLFWANLRADTARRLAAWDEAHPPE